VDYDPLVLGKFHSVTVPVYGEIAITAKLLLQGLSGSAGGPWEDQRQEIAERWKLWRAGKETRIAENRGKGIGFGYPAALGAWAAAPERLIVTVTGDGGFAQYMGELCTAVKYGMKITHVLLNNSELGKISKEQRQGQFPVWATSLHNPDFSKYAEICGAWGVRVSEAEELDAALESALTHDGPALVEVLTDPQLV